MTTTDIIMIGAGSTGCRLVKEYQNRNPGKACMFSYQEKEPLTPTKMIMAYAPACTIIVAGLGGNAGSTFAPEIAKHAKEHGRVFAVITLPFPFEMQRRARAMEALACLEVHVEALFVTDLGKVLESVPRSANTGDVMHDVNEKILDTLRVLYEAHQADHGFSVDALEDKLPQGFIEVKKSSITVKASGANAEELHQVIDGLSRLFDLGEAGSSEECKEVLDKLVDECAKLDELEEKQETAEMIADLYYKLAEQCQEELDIIGSLKCMVDCRRLHELFPSNEYITLQFLQCMLGHLYVKNQCRENSLVEEFMQIVFALAEEFPKNVDIQQLAAVCIQNLIALCDRFDAPPISLAYDAIERVDEVANRFPEDEILQNAYAHILVSACAFGKHTDNWTRFSQFLKKLERLVEEKEDVVDSEAVWEHFEEAGCSR